MLEKKLINYLYNQNLSQIENNINKEYHKRVKEIKTEDEDEKNNIKLSIIGELYYKEGLKDGFNYAIKIQGKNKNNS